MPRIYAPNEAHDMAWGAVDFVNGVAAVADGMDTSFFEDIHKGYVIDESKHALTVFDQATREQLEAVCDYLDLAYTAETTKQELVRAIEGYVSTANITALTVTSEAGTESGDTKVTVADDIGDEGNVLYYHIADAAVAPLYRDIVPATEWTVFESGDDITAATGKKITVVEADANGVILSLGSATVTAKA